MADSPPSPESILLALGALAFRVDDPAQALEEILGIVADGLGADSGSIALLNPDSGKLEIEARFGLPHEGELSMALGQGLPGWAAWHGKPVLAADAGADPRYRAMKDGVLSQMAAPMVAPDGQVLAVITLDRATQPAFGPGDLDLLTRCAETAAQAMRRLWQLDHLGDKARQLEMLLTNGQALLSKLEEKELFEALARDTRQVTRAAACALFLYEPATTAVRLAAFTGSGGAPQPGNLPLDSCLIAAAIHTRRPVAFADIQSPEYHDLADLPRDETLRSVLVTPLPCDGGVLGVLAIFTDRVRRFDNDEKRLCGALASMGAVALQNARLYARVFKSEESLRKNEQLTTLGLLAAEIAHEIRNPLTVLKLLMGGLVPDFPEGDPRHTDMRVIGEKLDQLEAIVTRVLNFAKTPSSLHARCSLAEIVEDTLVLVRLKFAQSKIQVRFEPPPRPLVVDGHTGQLQQVVLNLMLNAMQAMPDGGTITVTLGSESRGASSAAVIDVADTGTGIPDAIRDRIFDSFLTGRADGTGLGLAIAKRVMLGHHGDIALISTSPAGTTLRLTLPLAKAP